MKQFWLIGAVLAVAVTLAGPAKADQRYFAYTYDWFTPEQGAKEFELYWTQAEGGEIETQLEFEYGITNRWLVAPYLLLKREHGGDWEVEGWKLEQRYRFGEFKYNRFLPAIYFEVKKEHDEAWELEGKLITSYVSNQGWVWSNNLIFEGAVESGSDIEVGYSSGISFRVNERFRAGAEFFGAWTPEHEHFFGPSLAYSFDFTAKLIATVGFSYVGEEGGAVRFLFEKHFK